MQFYSIHSEHILHSTHAVHSPRANLGSCQNDDAEIVGRVCQSRDVGCLQDARACKKTSDCVKEAWQGQCILVLELANEVDERHGQINVRLLVSMGR